jgi:hypothetical protein
MTRQDKRAQNRQQLQSLLRELFQFDYADMDKAIHETHKQNWELYRLFRESRSFLVGLIQWDREWFDGWVADNPPPPGVQLVPLPP